MGSAFLVLGKNAKHFHSGCTILHFHQQFTRVRIFSNSCQYFVFTFYSTLSPSEVLLFLQSENTVYNFRNKQLISFTLCVLLNNMMKSPAILLCSAQDMNHILFRVSTLYILPSQMYTLLTHWLLSTSLGR